MDLSVIIVNWNVKDFLDRCLASLYQNVCGLAFEIIVVDNASRDGSVELVRSKYPQVRLIANEGNEGFCRANNQGLAVASGEFVVLLNPDTEVYPGAMEALVAFLRDHPDVGVVGPMLLSPGGLHMPNGTRFPTLRRELIGVLGLQKVNQRAYDLEGYGREDFTTVAEVDVVCGACLMTRRSVFEQIGGLDESLFMYFEEVDFCRRAKMAGWKVYYVPDARVYHHWMQSVKQDNIAATRRLFRSQFLYFRKHHGAAAAWLLRVLSAATVTLRTGRILGVRLRDRILQRGGAGIRP
ncbi:MAG: glycosyltransferase family 2 protein [Chthonomonadales bacterium]